MLAYRFCISLLLSASILNDPFSTAAFGSNNPVPVRNLEAKQ